jgi:hypothetical protein
MPLLLKQVGKQTEDQVVSTGGIIFALISVNPVN